MPVSVRSKSGHPLPSENNGPPQVCTSPKHKHVGLSDRRGVQTLSIRCGECSGCMVQGRRKLARIIMDGLRHQGNQDRDLALFTFRRGTHPLDVQESWRWFQRKVLGHRVPYFRVVEAQRNGTLHFHVS